VIRRKSNLFIAAGSLALAAGLGLRLFANGNVWHFATGFFLGVSIALMLFGLAKQSRRTSR
jgi:hypothetical protein